MATTLLALGLGLSGVLAACGGGDGTTAAGSSTTGSTEPTPPTEVPTSAAQPLPGGSSVPGPGQPGGGTPRTAVRPAVTVPATPGPTDVAPDVSTLPSGEIRLRSVAVLAVDAGARTFTLVGKPSGYSVVVTTDATQFKLAEGEPASFADVEPDVLVSVTGTASAADRVTARQVTILG